MSALAFWAYLLGSPGLFPGVWAGARLAHRPHASGWGGAALALLLGVLMLVYGSLLVPRADLPAWLQAALALAGGLELAAAGIGVWALARHAASTVGFRALLAATALTVPHVFMAALPSPALALPSVVALVGLYAGAMVAWERSRSAGPG